MSSPAVQIRHRVPRIAQEAVERARLSVVPRARTRAPKVPFVTLVSLVLVGGIVGLLLFNTSMQQASFAATSLEEEATNLAAREQTLKMELDELRNPQRVATEAQQMGMVVPAAPTFLTLDGEVEGVKTPATPEDRLNLVPPAPVKPQILAPAPTIVEVPATEVPVPDTTVEGTTNAREGHKKNRNRG
jgi:cell division protein FtsL